ncbi:MAG: hypothetical protein ACRDJU_05540 [Actinomycetota bacterium]
MALGLVAGVPLFDGLTPPPLYRWVDPPAPLAPENNAPNSQAQVVPLPVATAANVGTFDGQVAVQLPAGAFAPAPGQTGVRVDLEPVGPGGVPRPPPGQSVQGNVYRVAVTYEPSGQTATALSPFNVQLRYPVQATKVAYNAGNGWQLLNTISEPASQELLGTGVRGSGLVAAVLTGVAPVKPARVPSWAFLAIGAALVLVALPTLVGRRRWAGGGLGESGSGRREPGAGQGQESP